MKVTIAKTAGFCMGVRRAVELGLDAPRLHNGPIYTFGPLIHNPQVLKIFEDKGITVLDSIPLKGEGTVIIRAHGVPPDKKKALIDAGFKVIDATCPRVIRVQVIIQKHAQKGYVSIIVGDKDHPEVVGLLGYAGEGKGYVVASMDELKALPMFEKAIIVAQTTQSIDFYREVKQWASDSYPHYEVYETICGSTEKRQTEAKALAKMVDAMVIVGGKNSGNTRRLAQIVEELGKPAFHIETASELDIRALAKVHTVGLTAGASTPNWIIRKVFRELEQMPLHQCRPFQKTTYGILRFLLLTNTYLAVGAGCLSYLSLHLQGVSPSFQYIGIAMLYVWSMHILNHLTGNAEDSYNDPDRAVFYRTHRMVLTVLAVIAGGAGWAMAYRLGLFPFLVLLAMSFTGLCYNLHVLPNTIGRFSPYQRIRDLPGSKTFLIALAWGVVTALLPKLNGESVSYASSSIAFLWSSFLVFVRTAFFDILDIQGDRIVGKDTIPVLLGEKSSLRMLKICLGGLVLIPSLFSLLGWIPSLGIVISICPLFIFFLIFAYTKGRMPAGIRLEFSVESVFVLSGLISFFWTLV